MNLDEEQLKELEAQCEGVRVMSEGQDAFVLLSGLHFLSDGGEKIMDALLRPGPHSGYMTRLFLEEAIPGKPDPSKNNNWQPYQILGKTWHSWSWQNVAADQRLAQILAGHLRALA